MGEPAGAEQTMFIHKGPCCTLTGLRKQHWILKELELDDCFVLNGHGVAFIEKNGVG